MGFMVSFVYSLRFYGLATIDCQRHAAVYSTFTYLTPSGRERLEDPVAMLHKYPLMNDYWRDKRARIERIKVPAYILASYSTALHLPGSLRGFEDIRHERKW